MTTQTFITKLQYYLDAAYSLLAIETHEEGRVLTDIKSAITRRKTKAQYAEWDAARGMSILQKDNKFADVRDSATPEKALAHIAIVTEPTVFVLKDFQPYFVKPENCRRLRNLATELRNKNQTILLVAPRFNLPVDLTKEIQFVDFPMPDADWLGVLLEGSIENIRQGDKKYAKFNPTPEQRSAVVEAARGMTSLEAANAFSVCAIAMAREHDNITLDAEFARLVFEEKIVNLKNSFLEYIPNRNGFASVGGMEVLKKWALERRAGFEAPARLQNLPYPRGCLIAGFAGCGKTTVAGAIAAQFEFPLFKFDIGKLFSSKVGESEGNVREVIRLLDSLGRAVILIDELEKFLGEHAVSGGGDNGVSSRVFGTLLSWLSEKKSPTFLIGTVNNVELLPAALQRRGRFDEIWFVDLPNDLERREIFNALLKFKFKRSLTVQATDKVIDKTRDFTGAEIEAVIEDSIYALLKEPDTIDEKLVEQLVKTAAGLTPQAQLNPQQVETMRKLSEKGYRPTRAPGKESVRPPALARSLALSN